MIEVKISDNAVAWYAAIVATISVIIGYLNYLREKERVSVRYKRKMSVTPSAESIGYDSNKEYTVIEVVNLSKISVTIKTVGAMNLGGLNGYLASNSVRDGQVTIDGGKNYIVTVEENIINWDQLDYFVAFSVTGNEYRVYVAPWKTRFIWGLKKLMQRFRGKDKL